MKIHLSIIAISIGLLFNVASLLALPVSSDDLWQGAVVTGYSSAHYATGNNHNGLFDGNEGYYGAESGNSIFTDGSGTTHWVEWQTSLTVTLQSINVTTYHDFDDRNINHRGIQEIRLFYYTGSEWQQFYGWTFSDPNNDLHYGGGPAHQFNPDLHDMTRSYLELAANLDSAVTAQLFRAEFDSYNIAFGGPRVVELDAYDSVLIPEPFSIGLLAIAVASLSRRLKISD